MPSATHGARASSSLLLALLAAAALLHFACAATKLQYEWPDPKTGTGMQSIKACKVNKHNHTRHHVEAAGGLVAWSYGWRSFSYQLVEADTPMDWASCLASCVYKTPPGYTMLNIDSEDENNIILALLSNTPGYNCTTGIGRSAWLAVTDVLDEGKMTNLLDGSPPKWSTWAEYQPNNDGDDGQDCVRILKSGTLEGKWEDIGCNIVWRLQQQCICKHDSTPAQTDARFLGSHPQGTKKYWSLRTPRSWEGCRIGCQKEAHGRMVMPKNVEDHRSVIMLSEPAARDLGQMSIWFGANDMLREGHWWWLDGTPVDMSAPWAAGQPDNSRPLGQGLDEDCMLATVGFAPGPGLLHDTFCGRMGLCVCETD